MKAKALTFILTVALASISATINAQKTDISMVNSIDIGIACQVILVQGASPNVEIVGNDKAVANVETRIRGNKLTLTHKRNVRRPRKEDVIVKIEVENLKNLNISGVVDLKTVRELKFEDFTLGVSGVGSVEMRLVADSFRLNCSGVGTIKLSGEVNEMRMNVSGVGNVQATNLEAKNARVSNSGVGRVQVNASENLNASVSGIGSINYAGRASVQSNVSGLGRISGN